MFAQFTNNGAAELYYDNSKKFETLTGGAKVSGQLTATSDFIAADSGGTARGYFFGTSSGLFLRYNSGSNLQIQEAGSTRVTFDGSNVGIGTTSPAVELDIKRHTNAYPLRVSSEGGQGRAIVFADVASTPTKYNWIAGTQYTVDNAFEITPSTAVGGYTFSSPALLIKQDGKVGIGTNSPSQKLDVTGIIKSGGIAHPEIELVPTGSVGNADIRFDGTSLDIRSNSSGAYLTLQTATTERARIDSTGNFLVGKTANNTFNEGFVAKAAGGANITANQDRALDLNRRNNNGDIVIFRKDNTQVGSISVNSGYIGVGAGAVYLGYYTDGSNNKSIIPMANSTGGAAAGTIGLGINNANHKFKDAWITGAVNSGSISTGAISSGAITANGGSAQSVIKSSSDAPLIVESTDAYSGINFKDTGGNSSMFYHGSSDFLYLHSAKFAVAGSTLATGYQFQVNGSANLTGSLAFGGATAIDVSRNATLGSISSGNITTTGYLRGPSTFTIDPATHGDNTGTVVIAGNLQVDGTTTTINSTTLTVDDLNITLASGSANSAAANGAGITVDCGSGTDATLTYNGTLDTWEFNKRVDVTSEVRLFRSDGTRSGSLLHNTSGTVLRTNSNGDNLYLQTAGTGNVYLQPSTAGYSTVVNEDGIDSDFRVESDGNTHAFFVDAGNSRLGINTSSLTADGLIIGTNNSNCELDLHNTGGSGTRWRFNSSAYGHLQIENKTDSTIPFTIRDNGRVGIGTTNPGRQLTVEGTSNAYIKTDATSHTSWTIGSDTYGFLIYDDDVGGTDGYRIVVRQNSGNVGVGTTQPQAKFQVEEAGIETTTTSTTATTQVAIDSFQTSAFRSARYTIQVTNSTDSTYHLTEILLIHDGTTPAITEYGTIFTGSAEATFDADISSGNVRLLATPATTDSMTFKVVRHCITV